MNQQEQWNKLEIDSAKCVKLADMLYLSGLLLHLQLYQQQLLMSLTSIRDYLLLHCRETKMS